MCALNLLNNNIALIVALPTSDTLLKISTKHARIMDRQICKGQNGER
jgi:hypothetical protein